MLAGLPILEHGQGRPFVSITCKAGPFRRGQKCRVPIYFEFVALLGVHALACSSAADRIKP